MEEDCLVWIVEVAEEWLKQNKPGQWEIAAFESDNIIRLKWWEKHKQPRVIYSRAFSGIQIENTVNPSIIVAVGMEIAMNPKAEKLEEFHGLKP